MIDLQTPGTMTGGLGLFLLGMGRVTDGLKLAAGPTLHRIVAGAARSVTGCRSRHWCSPPALALTARDLDASCRARPQNTRLNDCVAG